MSHAHAADVNAYLEELAGEEFASDNSATARWSARCTACVLLRKCAIPETEIRAMLKILVTAALLVLSGGSLAQTQPGQTTPSIAPSQAPAITPSQPPAVTPSQTPSVLPPDSPPVVGGPAPMTGAIESRPLGGLSQCDNLIGLERERCLQAENAARGSTAPAGTPR